MYLPRLLLLSLDLDMHSSVVLQAAKEGVHTCDFPLVFLEKAMWAGLSEYAPPVAQLMQRFFLEESLNLEIEGMLE